MKLKTKKIRILYEIPGVNFENCLISGKKSHLLHDIRTFRVLGQFLLFVYKCYNKSLKRKHGTGLITALIKPWKLYRFFIENLNIVTHLGITSELPRNCQFVDMCIYICVLLKIKKITTLLWNCCLRFLHTFSHSFCGFTTSLRINSLRPVVVSIRFSCNDR